MLRTFLFATTLVPLLLFSQTDTNLPDLHSEIKNRIQYLLKDSSLRQYFNIDPKKGISIYASPADKTKNKAEFFVSWNEAYYLKDIFEHESAAYCWKMYQKGKNIIEPKGMIVSPVKTPEKPLFGIRIALDPGHIAGDYTTARLERKSVQLKKDSLKGIFQNDTIIEGKLTLATALLLKQKLEKLGAVVMLTREKENQCAFGKTFEEWWKEDLNRCLDSAYAQGHITLSEKNLYKKSKDKKKVFREYFLQEDLRERARKINAFDPDLAIIIHFNVDEKNEGWTTTTTKNYCMTFVPGGIFPGALQKKEARYNLLRLMITDHFNKSVGAAGLLCNKMTEILKVPLATTKDATYLEDNCIYTQVPGVFCRNLALTRLPNCPVVYGETLYQDNEKEFKQLDIVQFNDGKIIPPRLVQVTEAYLQGILSYFSK